MKYAMKYKIVYENPFEIVEMPVIKKKNNLYDDDTLN